MHYYYHHIGDFIKDTSFLTNEELGIYMKLIWLYYDSESPLENNPSTLAIKIGARDKVNQVEGILNLFFKLENNKWHQSRCNRELENYKKLSESGKKGAEKRWGNHRESIATPLPPHSHPNATLIATNNQEPITKNHIKDITPVGVSDSVFNDYLKIRKAQKKPWTSTAQKLMENEAKKAGISLQEAMEVCCARGWIGFKAEWHKPDEKKLGQLPLGTDQQIAHAYEVECGGDPTKARFNSYFEMRKFVENFRDKQKRAVQA
jgi:uncharacterized protein YdaU (DUF1376 family)